MSSSEPASLGRVLCIITGASRGFGRTVATEVSRLVKPGSALVLAARSGEDLRALRTELTESEAGRAGLRIETVVADVGQTEGLDGVVGAAKEAFTEEVDHVILVNNAGELLQQTAHNTNINTAQLSITGDTVQARELSYVKTRGE